ncbi:MULTISPECIES: 50S ribosomal protein L3 [unclassified Halanaerobium]|jgi:large subunit ribosomal protein L3|uniref:50S ribosomal protein L3 n=1 Tax=unclassified Halanaerobium TaxID=2641197 RepID=UPI000DF34F46|nr:MULTISPECIES: 50S ribosomal protein L3 [unclassified Halanaerobium]RCW49318.1 LSU ribosomal protein L3P [Halanaerobium sp. MA284_MarDTE_T2]RCW84056.1 LSU ribosomal protein L3P [Halanaerobium sp. DL-01]
MAKTIIAKKLGMTQYFKDNGEVVPVTVVEAGPCVVTQVKTTEKDGYNAVQLGFGEVKTQRLNKPIKGQFESRDIEAKRHLREFKNNDMDVSEGSEITVDIFEAGELVNVTGISKGKGFAGNIKRWNHNTGPKSHGSHFHRAPGSIGAVDARRVFKGFKLPGRMGSNKVTEKNLEIVKVDTERNVLLIKGPVPGPKKGILEIQTVEN